MGHVIKEKRREGYNASRLDKNGNILDSEFYESRKVYYDSIGRRIRTELYDIGRLEAVYEFEYN